MVRIRCAALQAHEKRVSLSFEGITLTEMLGYHEDCDELSGFVSYGKLGSACSTADQRVILMVRGLTLRWKQIIGYYPVKHSVKGEYLDQIIADAVNALQETGLSTDVMVMDQESGQWS